MRSEQELKKLAKEVYENKIFLANTEEHMRLSFGIILALLEKDKIPKDVVAFYEYYTEALPRGINGLPMFMSCGFLIKDEWDIFYKYYQQYKELVESWE